jgi:hypothetical protein
VSRASLRMYFTMLGMASATVPVPPAECDPYTRPAPTAVHINLTDALERMTAEAVDVNLCAPVS